MKRLQAFKYELNLIGSHVRELYRIAGSCRFVYNKALALQKSRYEQGENKLTYAGLCKELTGWRNQPDYSWLKDSPSQALQQSLKDLGRAYQNFFDKRADFPRRKKRGAKDAFRFPQGIKLDQENSRIYLPKLGWVRYRNSRSVEGEIKNVTISRSCQKWYVSIQTECEVDAVVHSATTDVGIDMGVVRLATLSNGRFFESNNKLKHYQKKIAAHQRKTRKKKKFSRNWKKEQQKIARLHQKMSFIRKDDLHKASHIISKNHAMICLEDLKIKNMSKSASGTLETPGKNVKAKSGLNKAILNQGWYELRRQLEYKQLWRGGIVVAVSPKNTSRTCPNPDCGYISAENRVTQSLFICRRCRYENHADVVGAINVLRAGHARLACGERVLLGHSMNQEPIKVTQAIV